MELKTLTIEHLRLGGKLGNVDDPLIDKTPGSHHSIQIFLKRSGRDGLDCCPSSVIHCIRTTFCVVIHQTWLLVRSLTFWPIRPTVSSPALSILYQ
jgi:hypothetical protein